MPLRSVVRRAAFLASLGFLTLGLGLVLAHGAEPAVPEGPLPKEALDLPAELHFVMSLDVRRFVRSPFYARLSKQPGSTARPAAMDELALRAGIDLERDVERIVVGGFAPARRDGVALAYGTFDLERLERSFIGAGATRSMERGVTQYRSADAKGTPFALAVLHPRCLLLGDPGLVGAVLAQRGRATLKANVALGAALRRVSLPSTFWLAADDAFLAQVDAGRTGGRVPLGLPRFQSLFVTAELEPNVSLAITAEVSDAASARQVAEMLQGFLALAALQAGAKPQLAELPRAVTVESDGPQVRVRGSLSYELVEQLWPKPTPPGVPGVPAAPTTVAPERGAAAPPASH